MKEVAPSQRVVRFSAFEVDLRNGEVRKHGFKTRLQDQPFHVLQILLEHPGELVTREELQRQIWPADTFVDFEKGLNNAIKRLRDALGDSAETPRFIETIPRRGYRFIAPVNRIDGDVLVAAEVQSKAAATPETPASHRRLQIGIMLGLGAAALLLALLGLVPDKFRWRRPGTSAAPQIRSLAVLPLQNLSADPAQEYFSDGMTDALITDLAQIGSLKVISRSSTMRYKKTDKSLPEIARELNVDGIVEGTVQRSGDRVRITAQLIYAPADKHLWANSYERDTRDVFALERDLTEEIVREVRARLTTPNQAPVAAPRLLNVKVLEAYLQGNSHLNRYGKGAGDEELKKAQEYFQQVIDADPNFAPAYNGLANAHLNLLWPSNQDFEIATRVAERAVELDPTFADARVTLAYIKDMAWDFRGAEDQVRRAIALNPNNASAHKEFSDLLVETGRPNEALREGQLAEQLDPKGDHLLAALQSLRDYDRAIATLQTLLQNDPDNGYFHHDLFRLYAVKGMYREAVQELEQAVALFGYANVAVDLHRAFVSSGYRGAMRQYAEELESHAATGQAFLPVNLAEVYATLGNKERAFYWLGQAYTHHEILAASTSIPLEWINVDPMLDPLRSDPRFKDLVRRVGLPP